MSSIVADEAQWNSGCIIQSYDFSSAQLTVNVGASTSSGQLQANPANSGKPLFSDTMKHLRKQNWYWGGINWEQAENVLENRPDGSFLVRDSASERYIFTISFNKNGRTFHARVPQHAGKFSFGSSVNCVHSSEDILDFIQQTVSRSVDGSLDFLVHGKDRLGPTDKVKLVHPVSRYCIMSNLKHLCRETIVTRVDSSLINKLPLPQNIIKYLLDPKYITPIS